MKVFIAGCGFAGLSTAWHLLQYPSVSVTLFDPKGIGEGASGVSTGLLHPFPGKLGLKSWQADAGMKATLDLISHLEEVEGLPLADRSGILRLALTKEQEENFRENCDLSCEWWPKERVLEAIPEAAPAPAMWIPQGTVVYSKRYLRALWKACEKRGAVYRQEEVSGSYDILVWAVGADILQHASLPLQVSRGQTLLCRWPETLPCALLSNGHLTPTEFPDLCQIGSTYEDPRSPCDPKRALELKEKAALFYPPARDFEVVSIGVGFRIARDRAYRPIVAKTGPKTWVFAGLGSRGLLYHAWLGKALAEAIAQGYEGLRPEELYKSLGIS